MRANWNFRIPDVGVTCEPDRNGERIVQEPILLIEVLSPSNTQDTYENIRAYATLPSVQELLVVHSTRIEVELLRKGDGNVWPANPTIVGRRRRARLDQRPHDAASRRPLRRNTSDGVMGCRASRWASAHT